MIKTGVKILLYGLFWIISIITVFSITNHHYISNHAVIQSNTNMLYNVVRNSNWTKKERYNNFVWNNINSNNIKIWIFWDIMLSRSVWYYQKKYSYQYVFSEYNPFYDFYKKYHNDIWVGNLESPFSLYDNDIKKPTFKFAANVNNSNILYYIRHCSKEKKMVLNLANNHIRNAGVEWFKTTKSLLNFRVWNVIFVWVGLNPMESHKIKYLTIKWKKVCFQWYSYDWWYRNWLAVNSINLKYIKNDIDNMNKMWCDMKVIMLHWWREYKFYPTKKQRFIAKKLAEWWVDIIIWWHSHVPWLIEKIWKTQVIYSTWNSIFDQNWGERYRDRSMDCVKDKRWKCVVPTYVWMLLWYWWNNNKIEDSLFYRIDYWKLKKLNDNILIKNIKNIIWLKE